MSGVVTIFSYITLSPSQTLQIFVDGSLINTYTSSTLTPVFQVAVSTNSSIYACLSSTAGGVPLCGLPAIVIVNQTYTLTTNQVGAPVFTSRQTQTGYPFNPFNPFYNTGRRRCFRVKAKRSPEVVNLGSVSIYLERGEKIKVCIV